MVAKCAHGFRLGSTLLALAIVVMLSTSSVVNGQNDQPPTEDNVADTVGPNLLTNPYFDTGGYYFRSPNSLVAPGWFRWDVTRPDGPNPIPEFIDGGSPYHNACYPEPPAGGLCTQMTPKNRSQGYIKWGGAYIAGVWQPAQVTACQYYQFAGYVRTDAPGYRPKVGIDPTGWQMPLRDNPNPELDYVCPPTGHSLCPKEHFAYESDMPASIVWSAPYAYDPLTPPIHWRGPLSVTTEAFSTTITVWTYAAPSEAGSQSTYWDYMSLVQVPPPNGRLIADVPLPTPDGSITNVLTETTALRATLSWETSQPALTQVLYHYVGDAAMPSQPPQENQAGNYELSTSIDPAPASNHQARLPNLRPMSLYDYVILSRRPVENNCQTDVFTGRLTTTDSLIPTGPLPAPSSDIIGMTILPLERSAYVIWQSAKPSYSQALYHYSGPITPTLLPTLTQQVYLPMVASSLVSDFTTNYEFRTAPVTTSNTLHIIQLTGLQKDSMYAAVAVSAWTEGDQDMIAVSARTEFRTATTPALISSDQLLEKLQACVARGNTPSNCAKELSR